MGIITNKFVKYYSMLYKRKTKVKTVASDVLLYICIVADMLKSINFVVKT